MAKMRSPNYPAIGLPDAVNEIQKIWEKEKKTAVSVDVLGAAMGYTSLSGPVRTKVAALRKYGLLDQNNGRYSLSELAVKILHGQPEERSQALAIAAQRPELFRELYSSHAEASDAALKSELVVHREFSEAGAKQFIKAFRDTLSIASPSEVAYNPSQDVDDREDMEIISNPQDQRRSSALAQVTVQQANAWTWTLSIPRSVRAELRIAGNVTREDVKRLKQQIEFLEESFDDAIEKNSGV
jgi:hypothetical protein